MWKRKAHEGIISNKPRRPRVQVRRAQLDGSYVDGYIEYSCPDCPDNNQPEAPDIPASLSLLPPVNVPEQDFPSTDASQEPEKSRYRASKERELAKWDEIRDQLLNTATELSAPTCYICSFCGLEESCPIRCDDCGPTVTYCNDCCERHHLTPAHNPQQWHEDRYKPFQLSNLDSTILERQDHRDCPSRTLKTLKVFNSAGRLQNWVLTFCQCEAPSCTLLRYGLWGATVTDPQTAYATSLLEWLVLFTLEAQVSVEAFCRTVRLKNNLSRCEMSTLYKSLIGQPITEFRHFMYRQGTAKDLCPQLDDGTTCPACPKEEGTQIIALDGNFGLVRKASSGTSVGPPLHGTSMFMEDVAVRDFVNNYNDRSTPDEDCSQFKAGNSLRSQTTQSKLDVTGVFGSVCRHEIPRRFLNMTHGERLGYPVLLITELLKDTEGTNVNLKIVYDISCVLVSHLKKSNPDMLARITPALDVFHAYGHKSPCQIQYSTRRLPGFGLTDGESVERMWAYLRRFASTTKEMTPSRRVDLLTDALLHYSRRKSNDMELTLKKKLDSARKAECVAQEGLAAVMEDANVSMDDIKTWATREKEAICREKSPTPTRPGWQQDYATKLQKLKAVRNKILTSSNEDDAAVYQSSFAQLDKELREIERKKKIAIRWTETSEDFINTMREVDWNTRSSLLSKMRSLAYERSFLSSLKRKYPDGQKIAGKLAKQLKATNSKLQKTINSYNAVEWKPTLPTLPTSVQFREASDSAWQHYSCLDPTVLEEVGLPRSIQRKGIDHLHLLHRATEEKEMVVEEMRSVFQYLQTQYDLTEHALDDSENRTNGQRAALTSHLMSLEKRIVNMYKYFEHNVPELDLPLLPSTCLALYPFQEQEDGDTLSDDETYSSDEEYDNID